MTRLVIHDTCELMEFPDTDINELGALFPRTEWTLLAPFPEIGFPGGLALKLYNPSGDQGATCWEV